MRRQKAMVAAASEALKLQLAADADVFIADSITVGLMIWGLIICSQQTTAGAGVLASRAHPRAPRRSPPSKSGSSAREWQ